MRLVKQGLATHMKHHLRPRLISKRSFFVLAQIDEDSQTARSSNQPGSG